MVLSPMGALAQDWPTYHGDNTRQGADTVDPGLASPVAAWTSARLDGNVYGAPVVVGNQVIVATENNTVYSLDSSDGAVQWINHIGTPRTSAITCGDINPLGITATPVVDNGSVFVVANIQQSSTSFYFDLVSLSLSSGSVNWQHDIDPSDSQWSSEALSMEDRGALLVTGGRVVVPMGGNYGDCGTYHGYVVGYSESNSGSVTWWATTEVDAADSQGAIWAAGGLSEDANGYVYAGTGNSNHGRSTDQYDYSDGVIKLDPSNLAPGAPVDYFAPSTWYQDNAGDVDLGSTTPLQLPGGRVFIVGKSGTGYLLNTASLGHIGGQIAAHQVCHATNDAAFGSLAYANGVAFVGCSDGLAAVQIASGGNDFSTLWYNTTNVANHPPTVAGGLVWSVSSGGGQLLGLSAATGQLEQALPISGSNHFTTPTAANGQLYVAGRTYVNAFSSVAPPPVNGITLDAYGGVHHFGSVSAPTGNGPYWAGWKIARGVAVCANHTGGYILDGFGGVHPFGSAPSLGASAYWPGWDVARAIVVASDCSGGYVLDGFGGVHPFGSAPAVAATAYWPNWDIAVAIVLRPDNRSGWVMDGFGGLHPFAAPGTTMPPFINNGPYWPGWKIARGATLDDAGGGYILDGFGGIHPFGDAPAVGGTAYWPGWDVARGISEYSSSPPSGYVIDAFGGLHAFGGASYAAPPAYLPSGDMFPALGVTS